MGPTFDLSEPLSRDQRIGAEADLIADGLLVDMKTQLGSKSKAGLRYDTLTPVNLYQLIGYALLDFSDSYNIDRLGIYSARYGTLVEWPLQQVTGSMSSRSFDLKSGRQDMWDLMQQELPSGTRRDAQAI